MTARQQLTECEGYSSGEGPFSPGKAISSMHRSRRPNVSTEDIYTGNGVSELDKSMYMSALLDDGDEILMPSI